MVDDSMGRSIPMNQARSPGPWWFCQASLQFGDVTMDFHKQHHWILTRPWMEQSCRIVLAVFSQVVELSWNVEKGTWPEIRIEQLFQFWRCQSSCLSWSIHVYPHFSKPRRLTSWSNLVLFRAQLGRLIYMDSKWVKTVVFWMFEWLSQNQVIV